MRKIILAILLLMAVVGAKAQSVMFDSVMGYYLLVDTGYLTVSAFDQEDSDSYTVFNYRVVSWSNEVIKQGYVKDIGVQFWRVLDADHRRKYMFDYVKTALKL